MHQKERIDCIMDILKKNGYVTVKYLTENLHYSTATINRDLNVMQKQKLIKRNYGGVELVKSTSVPLVFRYHKMRISKNKIAKEAAGFINDGDTVFMDGSTTVQYMAKYITERKNLTVITNNLSLASYLSEYGINAICLGGNIVEIPSILYGPETVENIKKYYADKMFFSTGGFSDNGNIFSSSLYYLMLKAMHENSEKTFFLADKEKIKNEEHRILFNLDDIDYIITDHNFDEKVRGKYSRVKFVGIE